MTAEVRARRGDLVVVGHGRIPFLGALLRDPPENVALGTLGGAGPASFSSLRRALISWRQRSDDPESRVSIGLWKISEEKLEVELEAIEIFDFIGPDREVHPSSPMLRLEGDRLRVRVVSWTQDRPDVAGVRDLLAPFFERHNASYEVGVVEDEHDLEMEAREERPGFTLRVDIDPPGRRGVTVAAAWKLGDEALALLRVKVDDEISRTQALDLLRARRWELFRGQPESEWLDAKGAPYGGSGDRWKHELAKDVAAFANSPEGGIIVIGMATEKRHDIETIERVRELELSRITPSRYRQVIAQWVFPEVDGLAIERIEGEKPERGLALLIVPPQPEASRPFLVHRAMIEGKLHKHSVLLPFRRADETAFGDIASVHTRLRLGQQVIAGEKGLPDTRP